MAKADQSEKSIMRYILICAFAVFKSQIGETIRSIIDQYSLATMNLVGLIVVLAIRFFRNLLQARNGERKGHNLKVNILNLYSSKGPVNQTYTCQGCYWQTAAETCHIEYIF